MAQCYWSSECWTDLLRLDGSKLISGVWCYVMSPSEGRSVVSGSLYSTGQCDSKGKVRLQEQRVRWTYVK